MQRRLTRHIAVLTGTLAIVSACPSDPEIVSGTTSTSTTTGSSSSGEDPVDPDDTGSSDGATTSLTATLTSTGEPECGDGVVEGQEECDDGNKNPHDDCLNSCEWAFCGDGEVHDELEHCDDGNDIDEDGCPTTCEFAACGDGFVQLGEEECDDGNDDPNDGCDALCVRTRLVFVSSEMFLADFGGRFAADQLCQGLAFNAELPHYESFRAWLSDETGSPAVDFHHSTGRYALVTGIPVAANWADLTDGVLSAPISVDEHGELLEKGVFTNTDAEGFLIDPAYSCDNWTSKDTEVWIGRNKMVDKNWTDSDVGNPDLCGAFAHLYCVEQ